MKALITVGISASGKTTWAREYAKANKTIISNRDDLRFSLTGAKDWSEYKFDKHLEDCISELQQEMFWVARDMRKDFILEDTNLDKNRREEWMEYLEGYGYEVEIKAFPITLEEAWRRDGLRANGVGRDVIYKQWMQWQDFIWRKRYVPDESLPRAVIFDVDGTLAHMNGRKPYEWDKVGTDIVDEHVRCMLYAYQKQGYKIILLSGRDGVCYEATYNWFLENGITPWDEFIMRAAGDTRKDTVIKEEIFWRDLAPYYNVQVVIDDRPCVVRMWHDLKIPKVIAVGNQCVEF